MPYRKGKRKARMSTRSLVKRSNAQKQRPKMFLYRGIIPDEAIVQLPYSTNVTMTVLTGTPQTYEFRGNSIFDPDYTGVGHQAMGHDEYSYFYKNYNVVGSKIHVTAFAVNANSALATTSKITVLPTTTLNGTWSMASISEQPYSINRGVAYYSTGTVINSYMSTAKMLGRSKQQIKSDPNLSAAFNNNPATAWGWVILANSLDGASSTTIVAEVKVTYYVRLFDRVQLPLS